MFAGFNTMFTLLRTRTRKYSINGDGNVNGRGNAIGARNGNGVESFDGNSISSPIEVVIRKLLPAIV